MKTLSTGFRRQLERTVIEAREVAETGAHVVLETLAVHQNEPYEHMGSEQRTLHARLRARARQLGDRLGTSPGTQTLDHLVQECAFEHWHGMLFARFLAENHLLIEPEMDIAVSMDECAALAEEEGVDKWALAARFAHRMLPQVFRPEHPVFEVQFAQEHRLKLEDLVDGIPADVFTATDSLGWVYQFWQSKKKDEVNRSEVKIGANELPAVTQLFTEPYMVQFLLQNSLGAWWAAHRLGGSDLKNAGTEDKLRRKVAIPGLQLESLRFVQREDPAGQRRMVPRCRNLRWLAGASGRSESPRPLLRLRAFLGRGLSNAGSDAYSAGRTLHSALPWMQYYGTTCMAWNWTRAV